MSAFAVEVLSLTFSAAIPLELCFENFKREYKILALILGGASWSCSSSL